MSQQGDVLLEHTDDNGEITVVNGVVEMTGDFRTAAYLSLFGGNEDDDGRADNPATWWGNLDEVDPALRYVSETQHLLRSIPAISSNLRRIEEAVLRDLAWFNSKSIASSITVSISIPALNRVSITINIRADGEESQFTFTENWRAAV